jgi:NodT family efflux transporter outer membrane factor (OMF) lipoprotein
MPWSQARARGRALTWGIVLGLAGCAAGPNFHEPAAPDVDAWRRDAVPAQTAGADAPTGAAQRLVAGAPVPAQWWHTFASEELDRRIEAALEHSPTIASAQAALRQAQANVDAARGGLFPNIDAKAGASRGNANGFGLASPGANTSSGNAGAPTTFTLYNAGVDVGYTLDLFGKVRRGVEAQSAAADQQRFQLDGTYVTLAANVATASFREASLRGQIRATEQIVGDYRQQLDLVEKQNAIGAKSEADVLVIRAQVASAEATLPELRRQLEQTQTQLAVYLGAFPSTAQLAALDLDALQLPHEVPLSVPSELTRRRPDVRAAEAELHRATAQVGVATADLFPQITLSGSVGSLALHAGDLFDGGTKSWTLGANLLAPIFHGGTLRAQKRAAEAGLDKAAADYQSTVLTAFQNVADSLRALELDADNLAAQAAAEQSTGRSLELVRFQYQNGAASYLQVLDATRQHQQARIGLIQARAARLADTAALYVALGGGWSDGAATDAASVSETNKNESNEKENAHASAQ